MFGLSGLATGAIGGLILIVALLGYNTYENASIRSTVRAQVIQEAVDRAQQLIKEKGKNDAELQRMDDPTLCRELGFKWMSDTNTCG